MTNPRKYLSPNTLTPAVVPTFNRVGVMYEAEEDMSILPLLDEHFGGTYFQDQFGGIEEGMDTPFFTLRGEMYEDQTGTITESERYWVLTMLAEGGMFYTPEYALEGDTKADRSPLYGVFEQLSNYATNIRYEVFDLEDIDIPENIDTRAYWFDRYMGELQEYLENQEQAEN